MYVFYVYVYVWYFASILALEKNLNFFIEISKNFSLYYNLSLNSLGMLIYRVLWPNLKQI